MSGAIALLDLTLPSAAANVALDEALVLGAEAGANGEVLRLWEFPTPAVVLGSGCTLADDVDEAACLTDGVPIVRRASGGGTVLLGRGCLLYSLILRYDRAPELREIRSSYRWILQRLNDALHDVVPQAIQAGTSDLAVAGLKFSGTAQQRKRNYLLHHGSLLYDFDLESVGRYLRQPQRQPEYRAHRDHRAFLRNLPLSAEQLRQRLRASWQADEALLDWPIESTRALTAKYETPEWVRRR